MPSDPFIDDDYEESSDDRLNEEKNQVDVFIKFIRFTVIGALIGAFIPVCIVLILAGGMASEFLGYAAILGGGLGAIIGAVIGSPPWLDDILRILRFFD